MVGVVLITGVFVTSYFEAIGLAAAVSLAVVLAAIVGYFFVGAATSKVAVVVAGFESVVKSGLAGV